MYRFIYTLLSGVFIGMVEAEIANKNYSRASRYMRWSLYWARDNYTKTGVQLINARLLYLTERYEESLVSEEFVRISLNENPAFLTYPELSESIQEFYQMFGIDEFSIDA